MKLAFFNYLPLEYGGGLAKYFVDVSSGLKKRYPDLEIGIIAFSGESVAKIRFWYSIYYLKQLNNESGEKEKYHKIIYNGEAVKYIKAKGINDLKNILKNYDVIYCKNDFVEAFIMKFLIGYSSLPAIIFGFHTPIFYEIAKSWQSRFHNRLYSSILYRRMIDGAKRLHVVNKYEEKFLKRWFGENKVKLIHNPFNYASKGWEEINRKSKGNKRGNKLRILWVGRLTEQKGINDLVSLINGLNISESNDRISWNIVGDGELRKMILKLERAWRNVKYWGYVENSKLPKIYEGCDLLISTSRWESFPYTLIEAQNFGLPVVAYNIYGCREIVENGKNGFLVSSISQFQDRILSFREGKSMDKEMIKRFIRNKFKTEEIFRQIYRMFRDVYEEPL